MNAATEISQLRKSGNIAEALEKARQCYDAAPKDTYIQRAYGWVLFSILKIELEDFEQQRTSHGSFVDRFSQFVAEYQVFGANERPDMLYSQILGQAIKASRHWSGFLRFARWWDPQFLTAEDREPFTMPNGKQAPSLEMRFFYAIGRELSKVSEDGNGELRQWAEVQIATALDKHPDDQWLNYYQSKWFLDKGEVEKARKCLVPVVRRQRKAAWAWTLLGHSFEARDPDRSIICYFHSVQLAVKAMEVANTRVSLAGLLAEKQRFDEAAVQLHRALIYRTENGFKVSQGLQQLAGSSWFKERSDIRSLPAEPDVTSSAYRILDEEDVRPVVVRLGVVDHQNGQKALAHVAFNQDNGTSLYYDKFPGAVALPVGQILEIHYVEGDSRPRSFEPSSANSIDGFCRHMAGSIARREGQTYAFLATPQGERVFIPPPLLEQLPPELPEQRAECVACLVKDRQGKPGWRVLSWGAA